MIRKVLWNMTCLLSRAVGEEVKAWHVVILSLTVFEPGLPLIPVETVALKRGQWVDGCGLIQVTLQDEPPSPTT